MFLPKDLYIQSCTDFLRKDTYRIEKKLLANVESASIITLKKVVNHDSKIY